MLSVAFLFGKGVMFCHDFYVPLRGKNPAKTHSGSL